MIIKEIYIAGYGKYQQQHFSIDEKFHIFLGNNEAGKSTLYYFIKQILFGFPKRKREYDYPPKIGGVHGGYLLINLPEYGDLRVERYRQQNRGKVKVILPNGQQVSEQEWSKMLQPISEGLFEQMYAFNQASLQEMQKLTADELQKALLSTSITGSNRLKDLEIKYQKQKNNLLKSARGTAPLINQRLQKLTDVRQQMAILEKDIDKFQELKIAEQTSQEQINHLRKLKSDLERKLHLVQYQAQFQEQQIELNNLRHELSTIPYQMSEQELIKFRQIREEWSYIIEQQQEHNIALPRGMNSEQIFYLENQLEIEEKLNDWSIYQDWGFKERIYNEQCDKIGITTDITMSELDLKQIEIEMERIAELELDRQQLAQQIQAQKTRQADLERLLDIKEGTNFSTKVSLLITGVIGFIIMGLGIFISLNLLIGLIPLIVIAIVIIKNKDKHLNSNTVQIYHQLDQVQLEYHQLADQSQKVEQELDSKRIQILSLPSVKLLQIRDYAALVNELPTLRQQTELQESKKKLESAFAPTKNKISEMQNWLMKFSTWLPITDVDFLKQLQVFYDWAKEQKYKCSERYSGVEQATRKLVDDRLKHFKMQYAERLATFKIETIEALDKVLQEQTTLVSKQRRIKTLEELLGHRTIVKEDATQLVAELNTVNKEIEQTEKLVRKHQSMLARLADKVDLDNLYQEESELKYELEQFLTVWQKNELKINWLKDLQEYATPNQVQEVLKRASEYLAVLADNRYNQCLFIDNKLVVRKLDGTGYLLEELSTGTKDQLFLAIRLAFLYLQEEPNFPILIDDGWVHFDENRRDALFRLFNKLDLTHQIILFTSDKKAVRMCEHVGKTTKL